MSFAVVAGHNISFVLDARASNKFIISMIVGSILAIFIFVFSGSLRLWSSAFALRCKRSRSLDPSPESMALLWSLGCPDAFTEGAWRSYGWC